MGRKALLAVPLGIACTLLVLPDASLRSASLRSAARRLMDVRFKPDEAQVDPTDGVAKTPVVYEISTRPWLYALAQSGVPANCGQYVCLRDVPASEWQKIKDTNADTVWLMGLWQLGEKALAEDKANFEKWRSDLPDITQDDVIGSPYSIIDYVLNKDIGSDEDLAQVKKTINGLGMRLMVDFVPNHAAKDSKWLQTDPGVFLDRPSNDHSPDAWWEQNGDRTLAHGRSPWPSDLWADTFQLNYWSPTTIEVMTKLLESLATRADAVRCDMAMLALNDVWERAWGDVMREGGFARPSQEFWQEAIRAAKARSPNVLFYAEAYNYGISQTPEKELLVHLGFDFVYDKNVLDNMEPGSSLDALRSYITSRSQNDFEHTLHFVENHDEPRAAAALGGQQQAFAGSVLAWTLPGARLSFMGQYVGDTAKLVVQLRRARAEQPNEALRKQYDTLNSVLKADVFHEGTWTYIPVPKDGSGWRLVAWRWALDDEKRLVVINYSDQEAWGNIVATDAQGAGGSDTVQVTDLLNGAQYSRSANDMRTKGLTVGLKPWTASIFHY